MIKSLKDFKDRSDLIIANRVSENLNDVKSKVFQETYLWKINEKDFNSIWNKA